MTSRVRIYSLDGSGSGWFGRILLGVAALVVLVSALVLGFVLLASLAAAGLVVSLLLAARKLIRGGRGPRGERIPEVVEGEYSLRNKRNADDGGAPPDRAP